eukprot:gnl/MRDRNA2_/MRDRNA2_51707_c0_seq1.p1 gnl/MRDRNA2_/MRDRNA2_51707_c0~~gnl/MRDRNA2_/MRDRNA2_51707_c0_seq1.p1  ORF type:complete len:364 (-),score=52.54 gnl/MRDRNA2_/MRDRNA2_51707_c0_seq1:43-1074(-)
MEKALRAGFARQLGISNVRSLSQLRKIYENATLKPAVVQQSFYADLSVHSDMRAWCKKVGIHFQAFSVLSAIGCAKVSKAIQDLKHKYIVAPAVLFFGYLMAQDVVPLISTSSQEHMKEALSSRHVVLAQQDADLISESLTQAFDMPDSHQRRSYEHLVLKNGLKVIIASDPACDIAAAALSVGVGTLHEPKDTQGLAHFCEHMLFMGTDAFPEEAEYDQFLERHGGECNAATDDAMTSYSFDIAPAHLEGALDRFSQFFLTPLFTQSATEREINAVDSEYTMMITNDEERSLLLYSSMLTPSIRCIGGLAMPIRCVRYLVLVAQIHIRKFLHFTNSITHRKT